MTLEITATLIMLLSAILHAAASTVLKSATHKHAVRGMSLGIAFLVALVFVPVVPVPPLNVFGIIVLSGLVHIVYIHLTIAALERGDLGLVYPFMRGLAPVFAAMLALLFLGEQLSLAAILGLSLVSGGLVILSGTGGWQGRLKTIRSHHILFMLAIAAAITTGMYSVIDASGVRSVENPWSYVVWFGVIVEPACLASVWWLRRKTFVTGLKREWKKGLMFTAFSMPGFAIAIYVFSLGPVAQLSAVRETSVFFAALFATLLLREQFGTRRILLAAIISIGLVLLHQ